LAAAGVGRIGIVDDDTVDVTNLQRQILYATADVGASKVATAAERLRALNPQIAVDAFPVRLNAANAREIVRLYDVVVDGTDTFGARYLINDAGVLEGKPVVYGSIFRFDGQVSVFAPGPEPGRRAGPCYRCLYPEPPPPELVPNCAEGGVLGVLAGIVGTWQAAEALKLVLGIGTPLIGRLMLIDALDARVREVRIARDPACPLCGDAPTLHDVPPDAPAAPQAEAMDLAAADLDALLARDPHARVLDVREPHEAVFGAPAGAVTLPASELEARLHELDPTAHYVVACRVGAKSRWAAHRLRDAGFGGVRHLRDGLLAYAALNDAFDIF
jgi:adenylyltransferase/sulfurtransferase